MSRTTHEIMLSHGEAKESTSYPFWAVAIQTREGMALLKGIWFNREAATSFFTSHRYRFPKRAYVYAFSGNESHLEAMYKNAQEEAAGTSLGGG